MVEELLGRLSARLVFVVGKGGVGKSTTSAALALSFADAGVETHLLSTDPAHSLAALFGSDAPGSTGKTVCGSPLTVEELDASARANRWFGEVGEAIAEVVDRGTYLDREDVDALLDRSLPGIDEVMGAVRIAELLGADDPARVVVDTAPTGHALRLLDSEEVLGGWIGAVDAMAEKAGAVGRGLTGREIRWAGQDVLDGLRSDVARFSSGIRSAAEFVIVTRSGQVVDAETRRLAEALEQRGMTVAAVVRVDDVDGPTGARDSRPSDDARQEPAPAEAGEDTRGIHEVTVPFRADLRGCHGLRRWGEPSPAQGSTAPGRDSPGDAVPATEILGERRMLLFAGKGGVGKSTCAAATAVALSSEHDVLLVGLDPAGSLADVLGSPVTSEPSRVAPGLVARQLDARARFEQLRSRYHDSVASVFDRLGPATSATLDRRVLDSMLGLAPPGIDELFAIEAMLDAADAHDVLILDTAPTGHFLRLLSTPETALSWTRAILRILLKYRAVLGLEDVGPDLLRFARRLRSLRELLEDPTRAGTVVVTLAEPIVDAETRDLLVALRESRMPLVAVIQNRATPDPAPAIAGATEAGAGGTDDGLPVEAPLTSPPPVGLDGLAGFAARWVRA